MIAFAVVAVGAILLFTTQPFGFHFGKATKSGSENSINVVRTERPNGHNHDALPFGPVASAPAIKAQPTAQSIALHNSASNIVNSTSDHIALESLTCAVEICTLTGKSTAPLDLTKAPDLPTAVESNEYGNRFAKMGLKVVSTKYIISNGGPPTFTQVLAKTN